MGLRQKGRSRTWIDDHGWWLCGVEFQPSGFSKGSYLNVGCMWLWQVKDYLSFDEGYRVEEFSSFQDTDQFSSVTDRLAHRAAGEVSRYRAMFTDVRAVARYYSESLPTTFWPTFNAAVACGLVGAVEQARRFFLNVTGLKGDDRDWVLAAQADAEQLSTIAGDPIRFHEVVAERVRRTRELQKLPPVAVVDFS